jgi:hypothetical protein
MFQVLFSNVFKTISNVATSNEKLNCGMFGTDLIVVVHFFCGGNPAVWQENK